MDLRDVRLEDFEDDEEPPGQKQAENQQEPSPFDIERFNSKRLTGAPPPIDWLISGSFRRGELGLLAAMGAAGKSFLLLHLALRIIQPKEPLEFPNPVLGGDVCATGSVVLFCAEDNRNEVHRRLEELDPGGGIRNGSPHNLYIVTIPDMEKPLYIVRTRAREIQIDGGLDLIENFIRQVPDLALVVIDPIQPIVGADLNQSAEAVQVAFSALGSLAAKHNTAVILAHHMRKNGANDITSAEEAREAIRGSGDIVNRPRLSYALWPAPKDEPNRVAKALGLPPPQRNAVFLGAVVKANGQHNSETQIYIRNRHGLLVDRTAAVRQTRTASKDVLDALVRGIAEAAETGRPFMRTGLAGLHTRRSELPGVLHQTSKACFDAMVDELLTSERLVLAIYDGTMPKWLDVPGGPFAQGTGAFAPGAPTGKSGRKGGAA